ncbi:MAG TPA: FAD-dependent oxidoreductase [Candidatus Dormibacteraeota bacterium]|nr:FAD-dependent oxidoreductase [Candidatus Dormibacteraeota bacterium]
MNPPPSPDPEEVAAVDVAIVGAGIAGLLVAAYARRQGLRTLVVERRRIPGGRFSGELVEGAQLSTGALHLIPHGSRGPLARALRELGIDQPIVDSSVICSVWSPRGHVICTRPHHLFTRVLPRREVLTALRFFFHLLRDRDSPDSVEEWLRRRRIRGTMHELIRCCVDFALSLPLDRLAWRDFRAVFGSFWRHGGPGLPRGGCRALADRLLDHVREAGAGVLLHTEVEAVEPLAGGGPARWRVRCRDRDRGTAIEVRAGQVVGTAGGDTPGSPLGEGRGRSADPACGFKVQLLLPFSLVQHDGVMFCIGTRRLSGLAQLSNADPSLAPPGRHLVNTFHACAPDADPRVERREALRDLAAIAGREVDESWVLSAAIYRSTWPVNRRGQGRELPSLVGPGFFLAGDACKPPGLIMVEAAAESARQVALRLGESRDPGPAPAPPRS